MDPLLHDFLDIGNEYPTTNKTEDEIKRLTLEEDMPELKKAIHILYRGQPIQKPSVYRNLHKILLEPDSFSKIVPLVAEDILSQSEEMQVEVGNSFIKFMSNQELSQPQLLEIFRMTMVIVTLWKQPVLDTWSLVFHEILKKVPYNVISCISEASIESLSEQSQHPLSKYVAARMIGFIAEQNIKPNAPLFDRARFLCQDSEAEVRKIMAQEVILKICRNVGANLTENKYLEKIFELAYDSNTQVKLAAIDSIVEAIDIVSTGFQKEKIIPVILEIMKSINEEIMKKLSFLIGKIIYKVEGVILENSNLMNQIQLIVKVNTLLLDTKLLKEWVSFKNVDITKNVVYNIPYLLRVLKIKDFLKHFYIKSTQESNIEIRIVAMGCFHEVIKAFEPKESQNVFREVFEAILKEESLQVLEKVVPHLGELIPIFYQENSEDKEKEPSIKLKIREAKDGNNHETDKSKESTKQSSKESLDQKSYLEDIINIGKYLSSKYAWRQEITFMEVMNQCLETFDLKELGETYVDFLFKEMLRGIKDVRKSAIKSLVLYMKRNHYSNKNSEIIKKILTEFHGSNTFQNRLGFLEFYELASENFSRRFFTTHNFHHAALKLAQDKVAEIRKKFLENAIIFKKMLDEEDSLNTGLEEAVLGAMKDKNKVIAQLAKQTIRELRSLPESFFEDFAKEDEERMQREGYLKDKEKEELEFMRRKQQEELLRNRTDHYNALTSLLVPGRKVTKKYVWNEAYSAKLAKNTQSATFYVNETTPKNKPVVQPVSLPAIKAQKNTTTCSTISSKDSENKPKFHKPRIYHRQYISPVEPVVHPKKKNGSFSISSKEKVLNMIVNKGIYGERKVSRERNSFTETTTSFQVPETKVNTLDPIKQVLEKVDKNKIRVPTIRKKN